MGLLADGVAKNNTIADPEPYLTAAQMLAEDVVVPLLMFWAYFEEGA